MKDRESPHILIGSLRTNENGCRISRGKNEKGSWGEETGTRLLEERRYGKERMGEAGIGGGVKWDGKRYARKVQVTSSFGLMWEKRVLEGEFPLPFSLVPKEPMRMCCDSTFHLFHLLSPQTLQYLFESHQSSSFQKSFPFQIYFKLPQPTNHITPKDSFFSKNLYTLPHFTIPTPFISEVPLSLPSLTSAMLPSLPMSLARLLTLPPTPPSLMPSVADSNAAKGLCGRSGCGGDLW